MSYDSLSNRAQGFWKRTSAVKALNVTTGKKLLVGLTNEGLLQVAIEDKDLIHAGDIIETPLGDMLYISDDGQCDTIGLQTFPAPKVRYLAKLYRFSQESTDSFGRPPSEPQLVKEDIQLCSWRGIFYASSRVGIQQGDVLKIEDGKFIVNGTRFENNHTIRLSTQRQC
jgi:hypothetical protein